MVFFSTISRKNNYENNYVNEFADDEININVHDCADSNSV